jgi:hypothetical protein
MKFFQFIGLSVAIAGLAGAQTGTPPAGAAPRAQVAGTVAAVDPATKQITIKPDKGDSITVTTTDRSFLRRMPPGENDTKKSIAITLGDIAVGDRAVAIGQNSADQKSFEARTIYIMTRADVAQVHEKEQEDWQKRGSVGMVAAIDPTTRTITIKVGQRQTAVQAGPKTEFLSYALDSAQLSHAKPGTFDDIRIGDELHALGNRSADGATVEAEKIVSGSFKQIAATVESIDAESGSLKIKDLATKKSIFVRVNTDTAMKMLPLQLATMLARRYQAGGAGQGNFSGRSGGYPGAGGQAANGAPAAGGPGGSRGGYGGPGGGRGDLKQMIDRLPAFQLSELKPADPIMITTTEGTDASHLTVIMLLAGVEPLLRASPNSTRDIMSGWNLGGGGEGEGN